MADVLAHLVALVLYPGAAVALLFGLAVEIGAAFAFVPERGLATAARASLAGLRPKVAAVPALAGAAAVLALMAAVEVAAPFSPVPAPERSALVAAAALLGAGWLTWGWGWGRRQVDPPLLLGVQAAWLVSVLLPSVVPETVSPNVLGSQVFPTLLPLKIACAALYLACLPPLLQLVPEAAPQGVPGAPGRSAPSAEEAGFGWVRALLWLPYCGIFASLFFPPSSEDPVGLLRFLALTAGTAAVTVALAGNLARRPPGATQAIYKRLTVPLAAFTVLVAMLTAAMER